MILISMLPAVALLLERLRVFPRLLPLLVGLLLVAYCHEDRRQASVFADDERFLTYNVALTPYGAEVVHGLAGLHFRAQDYRACVATVDRFLRAMDAGLYTGFSPSPPRLIEMYVRSLAALGDGERAERVLASATLSWPEPGLFTLWRWLCLQRGDSPAAAAVTALERSRSGG